MYRSTPGGAPDPGHSSHPWQALVTPEEGPTIARVPRPAPQVAAPQVARSEVPTPSDASPRTPCFARRAPGWIASATLMVGLASCGAETKNVDGTQGSTGTGSTYAPAPARGTHGGSAAPQAGQETSLYHDFGLVEHGTTPVVELKVPLPDRDTAWLPLGYLGSCRCTQGEMVLRNRETGEEILSNGAALPEYQIQPEQDLILRLSLRTIELEPMDHPIAKHPGRVVIQRSGGGIQGRKEIPLRIRYGVRSPVKVTPSPVIDFGQVAVSRSARLELLLSTADPEHPVRFGPARCSDPRVTVTMAPNPGERGHLLTVSFTTDPVDPFRALKSAVDVETDHGEDYRVILPVSALPVPNLQVQPTKTLSFGAINFLGDPSSVPPRSLNVMDHRKPDAEVRLVAVRDGDGEDASRWFSCRVERSSEAGVDGVLIVSYRGGLAPPGFRGEVELASGDERLVIPLLAFHRAK